MYSEKIADDIDCTSLVRTGEILKIDSYLKDTECITLSNKERQLCDEFPTINECENAIKQMKNNKSPGSDGLPVEFYKIFWNDIKDIYYDSLKQTFEKNEMCYTQRLSIISLIHKKGERNDLRNYRPISLTNCDYKILAFVLAQRLQKVIDNLINKDQTAYIKGRFIGSNARLLLDIFEYCESNNKEGILMFLDFQKAFDSVEWNFLFKTLEKFNFGQQFIRWIKILYENPIFRIKNNGWISKTCSMKRGIRQGCPISAIIFLFVVEIMSIKINSSDDIKGFTKENMDTEIKLLQHADDASLPLANIESMENAIDIINKFSRSSGMKLNITKTEAILLGPLKNKYNTLYGVKITNEPIRCLGIYLGHDSKKCYEKNWNDKVKNLEKKLDIWKNRKLTIFGKCTLINTLALSQLYFNATILKYPTNETFKNIQKLIFNFLWGKRDRIKRNTLIGPIIRGGIGIVDIESKFKSMKASWIKRISQDNSTIKPPSHRPRFYYALHDLQNLHGRSRIVVT